MPGGPRSPILATNIQTHTTQPLRSIYIHLYDHLLAAAVSVPFCPPKPLPALFLLFSVRCNLYVAYNLYSSNIITNVISFNDSIFFIVFGIFSIAMVIFFWLKYEFWLAWSVFLLTFHSFLLCYFITDSSALAKLQLGALAVYFSIIFDLIVDSNINKGLNLPCWWCFQLRTWKRRASLKDAAVTATLNEAADIDN